MKKIIFLPVLLATMAQAQFTVQLTADAAFTPKEAYFYTISGSKDILVSKEARTGNSWKLTYPKRYVGMMKVYFPEANASLNFVSENKDVNVNFASSKNKITEVNYLDETNRVMDEAQSLQRKTEVILPALYQMKSYYKPSSEFSKAMDREIQNLTATQSIDFSKNPFVGYYVTNYKKFLTEDPNKKLTADEILNFIVKSDDMLENSSLLRPLITEYIQLSGKDSAAAPDKLLSAVDVESPRGQMILSELIEIFDSYGMSAQKQKYLDKANGLKCTITDRLASTIQTNKNTQIGAVFPDYKFVQAKNTTAKKLSDVKAKKKLVVFWASTCSHCETELPQLIPYYKDFKAKGYEIIGLSLDTDRASYEKRIQDFPWINDSELKGWYSSYADTYNVHATPTYFILDANDKILSIPDHVANALQELGIK